MQRRNFLKTATTALAGLSGLLGTTLSASRLRADDASSSIPVFRPSFEKWRDDALSMAWIGQSTVLINFFGLKILTDPILFDRVGIYLLGTTIGQTRLSPPALRFDEIPKPDIVLLSHAHMDHLDYLSLKKLTNKFPNQIACVIAANTKDVVDDLPWKSLAELDWNQETTIGSGDKALKLKALQVRHFGWRLPGEKDRSKGFFKTGRSYNAYMMERGGKRVVFGGDTAMTDSFKEFGKTLQAGNEGGAQSQSNIVDIAIMPIGAYNPWISVHCTPEEAVQMAHDMNARYFMPVHTNTFTQGREPIGEPIARTKAAIAASKTMNLAVDTIGKSFVLPSA